MAFISIEGVSKSFGSGRDKRTVLSDATLSVQRGEFESIIGMMGCGKSTFLKIIAGLIAPDEGAIEIGGVPVRGVQPNAAIVFQNYSLLPWLSVYRNIYEAVDSATEGKSGAEKKELVESVRATYEHQTDPRYAAARLWVDAIIDPAHTRDALVWALEAAALNPEIREFKTGVLQT